MRRVSAAWWGVNRRGAATSDAAPVAGPSRPPHVLPRISAPWCSASPRRASRDAARRRSRLVRLVPRIVRLLPRDDVRRVLGALYAGAHGRCNALGAQTAVHRGRLPVVLCGDGLLRAAADVLPPQRLLPRHRAPAAPRGQGGRLLRVRLRGGPRHGVAATALSRLALHARRRALADARVRALAVSRRGERGGERAGTRHRAAARAPVRRDHVPRRSRACHQSAGGRATSHRAPEAGRHAVREFRRRRGR